jgi:rhodanese-related sulfurtransferase
LTLNAGSSEADIAKVLPDKNALVVTYCAGWKCPASGELAERLHKLGYVNVVEYPEGIPGWKDAGNPVEAKK